MSAKRPKEEKAGVPSWIVSFTDMITLLLSFFVLLQSLAHTQDPDLFSVGQGSFRRAIAGLGIPSLLLGKDPKPVQQYRRPKHTTEENTESEVKERVIDPDTQEILAHHKALSDRVETNASSRPEKLLPVVYPKIRFGERRVDLDTSAKERLRAFADDLGRNHNSPVLRIEVVAVAAENGLTARQRWVLSAQRAQAVEDCLKQAMAAEIVRLKWTVRSWGAGSGSQWTLQRFGLVPSESSIAIVVLEAGETHGR